jgi:putative membrane protein
MPAGRRTIPETRAMPIDLLLAIAHHLLMFALLAVLVIEMTTIRPGLGGAQLARVGGLDLAYGSIAGLILIVGFCRVFFGLKGPEAYLGNPFFWAKIATFVAVAMLSVPPTLKVLAWRRQAKGSPAFTPPAGEIATVRRFMHYEAAVFVLIPIFAALMARGYGQ